MAAKLGEAGDRFGDYISVDCANLPCVSGRNPFANTKFTRPMTKISKPNGDAGRKVCVCACVVNLPLGDTLHWGAAE